jgi:hypothetical protein
VWKFTYTGDTLDPDTKLLMHHDNYYTLTITETGAEEYSEFWTNGVMTSSGTIEHAVGNIISKYNSLNESKTEFTFNSTVYIKQ